MPTSDPQTEPQDAQDDEDDYMSMVFADSAASKKETTLQRRARQKREAEDRARVKSKAEIEEDAKLAREEALATAIDSSNKGFKMLSKMGYTAGSTLGKSTDARLNPINIEIRENRGGIGLDSEKKRKIREAAEGHAKKIKADESDYRERMRLEREQKRLEGQVHGAMIVAESLQEGNEDAKKHDFRLGEGDEDGHDVREHGEKITQSLKSVNMLWRPLVRQRREKEQQKRAERVILISGRRMAVFDDPDEDEHDKLALGQDDYEDSIDEDLYSEDPELEDFIALEPSERLTRLVIHMREQHQYCFWCKKRYPDKEMEGCPGTTEEEHD